jgi:hypothetical protein
MYFQLKMNEVFGCEKTISAINGSGGRAEGCSPLQSKMLSGAEE